MNFWIELKILGCYWRGIKDIHVSYVFWDNKCFLEEIIGK